MIQIVAWVIIILEAVLMLAAFCWPERRRPYRHRTSTEPRTCEARTREHEPVGRR
ncbi:hypothetical protein OIE68_21055 [Nocardia vinacea]|uniref:hypothetical protein n=1 Tax=Nocardia vinacea TaxID=96468 RepID=UPI002E137057|nr:hypothetical protein OIE68_21055 [Nocardia vinacea]